jgi:glycosyltransferase involved in cell wall biosynthesis
MRENLRDHDESTSFAVRTKQPRLAYLCLNRTLEGQASYAHVNEIINGLRAQGWDVDLYEPTYARAQVPPPLPRRLLEFVGVQLRLLRSLGELDALYIRSHVAALPVALWARFRRIPVVQEVNSTHESIFLSTPSIRWLRWFINWALRVQLTRAEALVAVTPALRTWLVHETGHRNIHVVPNGANLDLFSPSSPCSRTLPDNYVVFFGLLAPWQGLDVLLQAIDRPEWPDEVSTVVMGDGTERTRIEEAATRNHRMLYLGVVPYSEVGGIVAKSLAGLSLKRSAHAEASPLKLYEMLACGVPAVVSNQPGQADVVKSQKCGIVVPDGNAEAVARAVGHLYRCPEQRQAMGSRGLTFVQREGSWESRAKQTNDILRATLRSIPRMKD